MRAGGARRGSARRRGGLWLFALACGALLLAWLQPEPPAPWREATQPPEPGPPSDAQLAEQLAPEAPDPSAPQLRPAGPDGPASDAPFYGFCPESDEALAPPERPQLAEQISLRVSEMVDIARYAQRDASSSGALKHGLRQLFSNEPATRALETLQRAPDARREGLDLVASAALILGARAYGKKQGQDALKLARWAVQRAPDDATAQGLLALAAEAADEPATARDALRAAHAIDRDEPLYALSLGQNLADTGAFGEAIDALDVYLRGAPDDVPIAQLRARLDTRRELQASAREIELRGVTVSYPPDKLDERAAQGLLREVSDTLDEAARLIGRPRRSELRVVVHGARSELLASTCVPTWTEGVFDGVLRLHLDALANPTRRMRVVRHETLHAQMRGAGVPAPQWFHEGLAQHFAREDGPSQQRSFALMVANRTYVPFASLEGSFLVIGPSQDARLAYHQSLAMVELLVAEAGQSVFERASEYLLGGGDPSRLMEPPVAPRVLQGADLLRYLGQR